MPFAIDVTGITWDTPLLVQGAVLSYQFTMDTSIRPGGLQFAITSSTTTHGSNPKEAVISACPGSMIGLDGGTPSTSEPGGLCWSRSSRDAAQIRLYNDGNSCSFVAGQTYYLNLRAPPAAVGQTGKPAIAKIAIY